MALTEQAFGLNLKRKPLTKIIKKHISLMDRLPEMVDLSMGGGGKRMDLLVSFIGRTIGIENSDHDIVGPKDMDDSAVLVFPSEKIVVTTDGHTVNPVFFPGGNIGDLAIAGTVNDLTVMGAKPLFLTLGMIIEEGFRMDALKTICETIGKRARETGVRIIAGDTKVMPKGAVNEIVLTTAGIGALLVDTPLKDSRAEIGDNVIVSGTIGDHGAALMALREGIDLDTSLQSDVSPVWPHFQNVITHPGVKCMKDITRGGLASALNHIASKSSCTLQIYENHVPIDERTKAICDILGLEPLEISSEGKVVIVCDKNATDDILKLLTNTELGKNAALIGSVVKGKGEVHVKTSIGGTRILDKPYGEPIPRVC